MAKYKNMEFKTTRINENNGNKNRTMNIIMAIGLTMLQSQPTYENHSA